MKTTAPLPDDLVERYHSWKTSDYAKKEAWFQQLAQGQSPRAMVISCCDSRVHVTSFFGAEQGELFIHRNIANFVPPYSLEGDNHGTSAAVEYAVNGLGVSHIIVLGHSSCGGVAGCHDMCAGLAPELEEHTSFVGRWVRLLEPAYHKVKDIEDEAERRRALEHEAVLTSIENLKGFPFVQKAIDDGMLTLHALWTDIGEGSLYQYIDDEGFTAI